MGWDWLTVEFPAGVQEFLTPLNDNLPLGRRFPAFLYRSPKRFFQIHVSAFSASSAVLKGLGRKSLPPL